MSSSIDLDAYFARIHWGGATTPTLETLAGLLRTHMRQIPFENLDVLLGRGVRRHPRCAGVRAAASFGAGRPGRSAQRIAAHAYVPHAVASRRPICRRPWLR